MIDLTWMIGHAFESLERRDCDWAFSFAGDIGLVVDCPWRLLERGRIRVSSDDDGQQFGLAAPIDSASEVTGRLAGVAVTAVALRQGTLDLSLSLGEEYVLEVVAISSGYEAWQLSRASDGSQFIAVGGGELTRWMAGRPDAG